MKRKPSPTVSVGKIADQIFGYLRLMDKEASTKTETGDSSGLSDYSRHGTVRDA